MKRLFLFSYFLLLILSPVFAQVGEPRTDLAIGGSGGVALNSVSFKPSVKQSMKPGATIGITARYTCEKYFSLLCAFQGELNYSQAGWKETPQASGSGEKVKSSGAAPGSGAKVQSRATLLWGLTPVCTRLRQTVKTTGNGAGFIPYQLNGLPNQHELKVEKKFEYGITGGLGMDISTKKGHHFIVEGRYFYGLSDMFGNSKKDPFARSANGTITAKVSYLFDIKKTNL